MIKYDNGGILVEKLSELPNLSNAKSLFLDTETRSFDPKEKALKPYHGHRIAGFGVTADDAKNAWYIPIRCAYEKWNLELEPALKYLDQTINSCDDWVNHNVKFDAHFLRQDNIDFNCRLVDTNTLAKIVNSDRYSHALSALSLDWLEEDISNYELELKNYLASFKSKDYGDIPGDIIGEYGCQDVLTNRKLYNYMLRRKPEQVNNVWETEIKLTPVLFDMEVEGMRVDPTQLTILQFQTLNRLLKLEEELHKLTGESIRPHTNSDCYDVLCSKYGLPVLGRTEKNEPSFDKAALISYMSYPAVRESQELMLIVKKIQSYRKLNTLNNFFVKPYLEHQVDGLMHSDYNQIVRTGRMSCRRPNAQQLSYEAKELILPIKGYDISSWDYAQIEFRIIVHYIKDPDAIQSYKEDPDTDFHSWVSKLCNISRKPAKSVNFAIAFGGGKARVVSMLALDMSLMSTLADKIDQLVVSGKIEESLKDQLFSTLSYKKGEKVYNEYHSKMPGIKRVTYDASNNLKSRGYVFNIYGRRRHLPEKASYRAFNSIVQSCAADVIKERTVALAPRYNKTMREYGIKFFASVHDEVAMHQPKGLSNDFTSLKKIKASFEDVPVNFRVPMRMSYGVSSKNWAIASGDDGTVDLKNM